jgi:hypothetical protein
MISFLNKKSLLKISGISLIAASFIFIYGWLGSTVEECIFEIYPHGQIRLCGPEYVGTSSNITYVIPAISILIMLLGIYLVRVSKKTNQ